MVAVDVAAVALAVAVAEGISVLLWLQAAHLVADPLPLDVNLAGALAHGANGANGA